MLTDIFLCEAWLKVLLSRDDIWRFFFMKLRDRGFEESAIPHHCLGAVQQLCFPLPASTAGCVDCVLVFLVS